MIKNGWINCYKPQDITSNKLLQQIKRTFNFKKAGFLGTLDPFASGVLAIAVGEATKTIPYIYDHEKIYDFKVCFGKSTDTLDRDGKMTEIRNVELNPHDIRKKLGDFCGVISQVPPKFSAIKIAGKRAYKLARQQQKFSLQSREITIKSLELTKFYKEGLADFRVVCSKGTYVRSLARDIAISLGTVGYVAELKRLKSGIFKIKDSIDVLKELSGLLPMHFPLQLKNMHLSDEEFEKLCCGIKLKIDNTLYKCNDEVYLVHCNRYKESRFVLGLLHDGVIIPKKVVGV